MGRPSKYPRELRERAARMVAEVRSDYPSEYAAMTAVAQMLGVGSPETIRTWIRRQQVDAGDRPGVTTDAAVEIKRLKRENAELRRANEILKAASVNSTRQRNTIDDHLGGVAWRRSGDRVYRRIGGNRCGSCGRRERRSVRSLERWGHRRDRSSRSCCRSAASTKRRSAVGRGR
ncbi:hypothetical protein GCM10023065_04470 [Microbacterium laevaniformans]|nr:hypothetical protein GCM10017578_04480 [Microbacterium laevaniformans]